MSGAHFTWLGHSAVRIDTDAGRLYIDPFQLGEKRADPADLVLVTNPRLGHLSPEDIELVSREGTVLAGPEDAVGGWPSARRLAAGDELEIAGFWIRAVPAGNRELRFYPLERGWLGYVIETGGRAFYHAGATERLPEMSSIRADVAFLPVSGRFVMGPKGAESVAADVGARVKVPLFMVGDRYRRLEGFTIRE